MTGGGFHTPALCVRVRAFCVPEVPVILQSLTLSNFRRFPSLRMAFHPQMTVIVAKNGLGKTSVLDGGGDCAGAVCRGL